MNSIYRIGDPIEGSIETHYGNIKTLTYTLKVHQIETPKYNPKSTVKIGAIGVGSRLRRLLHILLEQQDSQYEIVAISDESPEALLATAQMIDTFGRTPPQQFADYRQLLAIKEIDWIMIGSKNYLHVEHTCASFEAGKHVFSEKPLAISIEECARIRECQSKSGGKIFATGFVLRHTLLYSNIHRIVVEEEKLGKLISVEANETLHPSHGGYIMRNWRRFKEQSGPHILEKTSHDLDILHWLIQDVPSKVASFGGNDIFTPENAPNDPKVADHYKTWSQAWEDIDPFKSEKTIEDNVVSILHFRNGVKATFHTNACTSWPQRRILICGLKGTLEADLITSQLTYQLIGPEEPRHTILIKGGDSHGGGDQLIVNDLAKCMADGSKPKATGEEGFISALICLAIDEARTSEKIVDMEPIWNKFEV